MKQLENNMQCARCIQLSAKLHCLTVSITGRYRIQSQENKAAVLDRRKLSRYNAYHLFENIGHLSGQQCARFLGSKKKQ